MANLAASHSKWRSSLERMLRIWARWAAPVCRLRLACIIKDSVKDEDWEESLFLGGLAFPWWCCREYKAAFAP